MQAFQATRRTHLAQWGGLGLAAAAPLLLHKHAGAEEPQQRTLPPRVGVIAPELMGTTLDQKPFDLAKGKNQVCLVAFWATWCPTCRVEMPEFRRAHEKWMKQGFALVTVAIDRKLDDVVTYERIVERTVPVSQRFAQLWRNSADHRDSFGDIPSTPTTYLIDRKQRIAAVFRGRMMEAQWTQIEREVLKKA